jgi:hypothetical protein
MTTDDKLTQPELLTFFYLLVRDAMPAGEVIRIVRESAKARGQEVVLSNAPLEQFSRQMIKELLG